MLLMLLRVGACGVTCMGTRKALARVGIEPRAAKFLKMFTAFAAVWLLAFPFIVLFIAPLTKNTAKHALIETMALSLQSAALGLLLVLFLGVGDLGKAFAKASTLGEMGSLDAGGGGGGLGDGGGGGGMGLGASPGGGPSLMKRMTAIRKKVNVD
jgi:hypothetical protein